MLKRKTDVPIYLIEKYCTTACIVLSFLLNTGLFNLSLQAQDKSPVDYVNPFIGTDESLLPSIWEANGGTYPGATVPFGMVQFTPENYRYRDKRIQSFSLLNHTSGYPNGSSGNLNIMPVNLKVIDKDTDCSSSFNHKNETASPGYYSVLLDDFGIEAQFTVTQRAGICWFTYPESKNSKILIFDVDEINQFESKFITGKKGGFYFYAELSKSFEKFGSYKDGIFIQFQNWILNKQCGKR